MSGAFWELVPKWNSFVMSERTRPSHRLFGNHLHLSLSPSKPEETRWSITLKRRQRRWQFFRKAAGKEMGWQRFVTRRRWNKYQSPQEDANRPGLKLETLEVRQEVTLSGLKFTAGQKKALPWRTGLSDFCSHLVFLRMHSPGKRFRLRILPSTSWHH